VNEPKANNKSLKKIILSRIRHNGRNQIKLYFNYDEVMKNHLKKLDGVKWSNTHRCFYMPDEATYITKLLFHIKGNGIWVDQRALNLENRERDERFRVNKKKEISKETNHSKKNILAPDLNLKIEEYRKYLIQKRYSAATIKTYISMTKQFFSRNITKDWKRISKADIESYNYKEYLEKRRSYSTQNQFINAIKLFYRLNDLHGIIPDQIERPRRAYHLPDVLSMDEVRQILEHLPNLKHKTLIMLIYSAGLRIGEAINLKMDDIQRAEGLIYIRRSKGNKDRRVPLSKKLLEHVDKYIKAYEPSDYLFEGAKGGKYSNTSAAKLLKRAVQKTGITKRVTLHTLRHSYATHLTQRGVNVQYLQEILGHNSPKTTMLYTHLSGKDIKNIISPLDEMDI
jgi:site-specific recombinase XerD